MTADCEAPDFVTGEATGLRVPAHPAALIEAGAEWLTRAFRAYGAIGQDNAVRAIVRSEPCLAGNSGEKLLLTLDYARPEPGLHDRLFVKFSRHFGDAFRDRRRHELEGEVRLASLSRSPGFPVPVARPYFADFDRETGSGVLITERIAFGENGIEPPRPKNLDHELANPLDYYRATVSALARLAAAHLAGRLPEAETLFPFDPARATAELTIPFDSGTLREKVRAISAFVEDHPWVLLDRFDRAQFLGRLESDAMRLLERSEPVRRFLYADPRFVALTHWNTHIDNAWFWRDAAGVLRCGLLDWGMVRVMNVAIGLWGGLSGATPRFLDRHLDDLMALFVLELEANGGPRISREELRLHFDLSVAMIGLALLMDAPALVKARLPEVAEARDLTDPVLRRNQVGNGFLHTFAAFLNVWAREDFGRALGRPGN